MTLTEFLLARIAEDEAGFGGLGTIMLETGEDGLPTGKRLVGRRVIAECAAKRSIVREHVKGHCECRAVRILASVYSDHPDYQQEWKC